MTETGEAKKKRGRTRQYLKSIILNLSLNKYPNANHYCYWVIPVDYFQLNQTMNGKDFLDFL